MERRLEQDKKFYRVREICRLTGLSKPKVFQALHEGKLEGRKLGGVLLITAESVRSYLDSAQPWKPQGSQEAPTRQRTRT